MTIEISNSSDYGWTVTYNSELDAVDIYFASMRESRAAPLIISACLLVGVLLFLNRSAERQVQETVERFTCEINCTEVLNSNTERMSVPGGWIYTRNEFSTFVLDCDAEHVLRFPGECSR